MDEPTWPHEIKADTTTPLSPKAEIARRLLLEIGAAEQARIDQQAASDEYVAGIVKQAREDAVFDEILDVYGVPDELREAWRDIREERE